MDVKLTYRGRVLSAQDVAFIQSLIDAHPEASRRALSSMLCERWGWRQPNGQLRDMVCRSLMLELHRGGHIALPPVRCRPPNNVVARRRPGSVAVDTKPLRVTLAELKREITERDEQDRQRAASPLRPAADAVTVDTTGLGVGAVLDRLVALVESGGIS